MGLDRNLGKGLPAAHPLRAAYAEWLSGPFTKTVRRASAADMAKVVRWADENDIPYDRFDEDSSSALGLPPMRYADLPKPVAAPGGRHRPAPLT